MDPDVRFTLVLERESDQAEIQKFLLRNGFPNPERFRIVFCDDLNITMWSRDQMVGLFGPTHDAVLLAQTTMRPRGQDPLIPPRIVAANQGIVLDPDKRLVTDGGDEVSNSKETFMVPLQVSLDSIKLMAIESQGTKAAGVVGCTEDFATEGVKFSLPSQSFHSRPRLIGWTQLQKGVRPQDPLGELSGDELLDARVGNAKEAFHV